MRYNILGVRFKIETDIMIVREFFSYVYENFLEEPYYESSICYKISSNRSIAEQECCYTINRNGIDFGNYTNANELLFSLEQSIMKDIIIHISHLFLIHAAVLVNNEQAIILAGPSQSGKS